nr:SUMF1/EgtB/PvdO family nonheme iron enzyme [Yersinia alsatica]
MDLPTESQWEYAARNRGGNVIFATNNRKYEPGSNLASSVQKSEMLVDSGFSYPIGKLPPTPLGLFDMAGNGVDWISDWYDDSYYNNSPEINPQGPENGVYKVIRGYQTGGGEFTNQTVYRQFSKPDPDNKDSEIFPKYNFRSVVNK